MKYVSDKLQFTRKPLRGDFVSKESFLDEYRDNEKRRSYILYLLQENGKMSREEIYGSMDWEGLDIYSCRKRTILNDLGFLRKREIVRKKGKSRETRYYLSPKTEDRYEFKSLPEGIYSFRRPKPLMAEDPESKWSEVFPPIACDFKIVDEEWGPDDAQQYYFEDIVYRAPKSFMENLFKMMITLEEIQEKRSKGEIVSLDELEGFEIWKKILRSNGFIKITNQSGEEGVELTTKGYNFLRFLRKIEDHLEEYFEDIAGEFI